MTEEKQKETSVKTVEDLDKILNTMNRVNETFAYEVWIPSLNKEIMFREINTSQQKRLIKSIIDSPVYNTEFIFTLRQILKENCIDTKINVDELTILDKLFIAIKMRSVSIGDAVEIEITGEDDKPITRGIGLTKIIDSAKKKINVPKPKNIKDDSGVYTVECSIPSILTEYKLEDELRKNSEEVDINSPEKLRQTIGDAFIGEVVKYIKSITIEDKDETLKFVFDDNVSFRNRIALVEKLPTKLLEKVVSYINEVKVELDKVVLINVEVERDGKKEKVEERLTIDGSFFTYS